MKRLRGSDCTPASQLIVLVVAFHDVDDLGPSFQCTEVEGSPPPEKRAKISCPSLRLSPTPDSGKVHSSVSSYPSEAVSPDWEAYEARGILWIGSLRTFLSQLIVELTVDDFRNSKIGLAIREPTSAQGFERLSTTNSSLPCAGGSSIRTPSLGLQWGKSPGGKGPSGRVGALPGGTT
jgi:hypothetical protein